MGTRYHYSKYGGYRGCSSDQGPSGIWLLVLIILVLWILNSC